MSKYEVLRLLSIETNRVILSILDEKPMRSKEIFNTVKEKTEIQNRESVYKALERLKNAGLVEKKFNEKSGNLYYSRVCKEISIDLETMEIEMEFF